MIKGTFRRDAELVSEPGGGLRLRRKLVPRVTSVALVAACAAISALDAAYGRPWIAVVQGALGVGFVILLARAELDRFEFDGSNVVRRWLSLRGVAEARISPKTISRVGVARAGKRARCWIETKSGDELALFEGDPAWVEATADQLAQAFKFAAAQPAGEQLH